MRVSARTAFFGRAGDLDAIDALFEGGERLITLTGPGGTGKTRLATRYAEERGARWPIMRFCDLTEARTTEAVCAAVGETLDLVLGREPHPTPVAQLGEMIGRRGRALVVLDNCEQALVPVADAVAQWLSAAPEARWLCTSREPLRIGAERVHDVAPLRVPAEGEDAAASDAVRLFVERAQRVRRDFRLDESHAPIVAEIVRLLDGLPLAIELAAARMSVLGARTILERLPRRFDLLKGGARDAAPRQRTLWEAIDWSWRLLAPWEQSALAQASVFRGGFSPEAFERVVDLSAHAEAPPALEVLQALRDKSLVRASETPDVSGELRCALYESVRAFAEEQIRGADASAASDRHAAHFAATAEEWAAGVPRHGGVERLRRIALEADNLRAAHAHALSPEVSPRASRRPEEHADSQRWRDAARIALALHRVATLRGSIAAHVGMLDATIDAGRDGSDPAMVARLLLARARARAMRGEWSDAAAEVERALSVARGAGDRFAEGRALSESGSFARRARAFAEGHAAYAAALEASRAAHDDEYTGVTLGRIADLLIEEGRYDEAEEAMNVALAAVRDLGDRREEGVRLLSLGALYHRQLRWEEARASHHAALGAFEEVGDVERAAVALHNMGTALLGLEHLDEAHEHLVKSVATFAAASDERFLGVVHGSLAVVHYARGELEAARARAHEAAERLDRWGETRTAAFFRGMLGALLADLGRAHEAERIIDAAESALARDDVLARETITARRAHLDLAEAAACVARGDETAARERLARVHARLDESAHDAGASDLVRTARRMLARATDRFEQGAGASVAAGLARRRVHVRVAESGRSFSLPDGRTVDLSDRPTLGRVLLVLARRRVEAPGAPTSVDALIREGWPGERMLPKAGATRVYTMLAKLRALGLRDVLLSRSSGYLFDPLVDFALESDGAIDSSAGRP